jgi:hypothetical protein
MIHEENCTYEVCKLAKEKGFNGYVNAFYADGCDTPHTQGPERWNNYNGKYAAPTQSLLQRWLREEKGYAISVTAYPTLASLNKVCYAWEIKSSSDGAFMKSVDGEYTFSTYELALEDALAYSLKNLV